MLKLARQRDELRIVNDQIGAPTSSESLARGTVDVLRQVLATQAADAKFGTYHMTAAGETSWFGFAKEIFSQASAKLSVPRLHAIASSEYPTAARRPLNSRLNCDKLKSSFGLLMPQWQDCLASTMLRLAQENHPQLPTFR